jgi:hypothetical protein
MTDSVSSIRNLGPSTEAAFARIGVTTAAQLHAMGPDPAYRALLQNGEKPHFIGYYVLVMALQGRPWNDCKGEEKRQLRVRFDSLVAETNARGRSEFEAALNILGVIPAKSALPPSPQKR